MTKDTYEEKFVFTGKIAERTFSDLKQNVEIQAYTNPYFTGEPFSTAEFIYTSRYDNGTRIYYMSGELSLHLIESTDVYLKVVEIND